MYQNTHIIKLLCFKRTVMLSVFRVVKVSAHYVGQLYTLFSLFSPFLQFTLSKCMDAVIVMANSHLVMTRSNKLAIIASHCQEKYGLVFNCRHN